MQIPPLLDHTQIIGGVAPAPVSCQPARLFRYQISRALAVERHRVEEKARHIEAFDLRKVDIVFAGGKPSEYMLLLRRVREERPTLPFVVVTHIPETTAWLDALEAGATDYCSSLFETRQIHWLMEGALPARRSASAGAR